MGKFSEIDVLLKEGKSKEEICKALNISMKELAGILDKILEKATQPLNRGRNGLLN